MWMSGIFLSGWYFPAAQVNDFKLTTKCSQSKEGAQ